MVVWWIRNLYLYILELPNLTLPESQVCVLKLIQEITGKQIGRGDLPPPYLFSGILRPFQPTEGAGVLPARLERALNQELLISICTRYG